MALRDVLNDMIATAQAHERWAMTPDATTAEAGASTHFAALIRGWVTALESATKVDAVDPVGESDHERSTRVSESSSTRRAPHPQEENPTVSNSSFHDGQASEFRRAAAGEALSSRRHPQEAETPPWQQLRATVQDWAEQIALHPEMMVKSSFDALRRVLIEMDKLNPPLPAPPVVKTP